MGANFEVTAIFAVMLIFLVLMLNIGPSLSRIAQALEERNEFEQKRKR